MLSELWEKEKQRLADILFTRVVQSKDKICSKDILNGNYPEVLQRQVKNQAIKIFEEEKPIHLSNQNRYNLQSSQIKNYFRILRDILIQETFFTQQEISRMINLAIKFQYDTLVCPRQALSEMFYKTKEELNKKDVLTVLYGFGEDRPFVLKLISSIQSFSSEIITHKSLQELSMRAEQEVYKEIPISTFMKDISLLNRFEASVTGKESHIMASPILIGMLKERGLNDLAEGLRGEALEKEYWSFEEIESALERQLLVGGLEPFQVVMNEEPPLEIAYNKLDFTTKDEITIKQKRKEEAKSLRLNFVENEKEKTDAQSFEKSKLEKIKEVTDFDDLGQPLIINRRDLESQPPGPYPALRALINHRDQKVFIKKLFRKDGQKYLEFIQHLEEQDKWKDAKAIIDSELEKRGISPYSKEAVHLSDIVFSRYFSQRNVAKH